MYNNKYIPSIEKKLGRRHLRVCYDYPHVQWLAIAPYAVLDDVCLFLLFPLLWGYVFGFPRRDLPHLLRNGCIPPRDPRPRGSIFSSSSRTPSLPLRKCCASVCASVCAIIIIVCGSLWECARVRKSWCVRTFCCVHTWIWNFNVSVRSYPRGTSFV